MSPDPGYLPPSRRSEGGPWQMLRRFTPARVALGRAGGSIPTREWLDFRLAHAQARDAILRELDEPALVSALEEASGEKVLRLNSRAETLEEYLAHPDAGRRLSDHSAELLRTVEPGADLLLLVSEGLSALAAQAHAAAVVGALVPRLRKAGWRIAPVGVVRRARVALQDHAGELIQARLALILLGERPGLASPDSLGAYIVHRPRVGNTDAQRNCVSNISRLGLTPQEAAEKLEWLLTEARVRGASGVDLKDERRSGMIENCFGRNCGGETSTPIRSRKSE